MNRVAIAYSTKNRTELSRRSIEPLLQPDKFDLHWFDGSNDFDAQELWNDYQGVAARYPSVRGGADAAICAGLTELIAQKYDFIGLVENDVLLHDDWFGPTMALFERGKADGLNVGAVSARAYQDRILIQRDGYAVMHNLGAGMVIFTREAAELVLRYFRTGWAPYNRLLFSELAHLDIGKWWAFRGAEQMVTADWHFDCILASHGLASLALTPSPVEMIGQVPNLEAQGLKLADGQFDLLQNDTAFETYRDRLQAIREGLFKPTFHFLHRDGDSYLHFPHQLGAINAKSYGLWNLQWAQGFGPFAWKAGHLEDRGAPVVDIPIAGPCSIVVSGGVHGGKVLIEDKNSGYSADPDLGPEARHGAMQVAVPGTVAYRDIRVTMKTPGTIFYGVRALHEQPSVPYAFDWNKLPPVEE